MITIVASDAPTHFAVVSVVVAAVTSILMYITEKQERCAFKFLLAAVHCQIDAERALERKHKAEEDYPECGPMIVGALRKEL